MGDARRGYGREYQRARRELLRHAPACAYCGRTATTADHVPPLSAFPDRMRWVGVLVPSCRECNGKRGGVMQRRIQRDRPAVSRSW